MLVSEIVVAFALEMPQKGAVVPPIMLALSGPVNVKLVAAVEWAGYCSK
jgi:hypothetical protein